MRRTWLSAGVFVGFVSSSCTDGNVPAVGDTSSALAVLGVVGERVPEVATMVAPREGALDRVSRDDGDEPSRGRIVSEGWRATRDKRFDELGARLPDNASGALDVGVSRFQHLQLHVKLADASETSEARVRDGRVVYPRALPSTDRVLVANSERLEEFLVAHDARAPRSFVWHVERPEGLTRADAPDGGVVFVDARGRRVLTMPRPRAWDGAGRDVALDVSWLGDRLRVDVPNERLGDARTWPLVIDVRRDARRHVGLERDEVGAARACGSSGRTFVCWDRVRRGAWRGGASRRLRVSRRQPDRHVGLEWHDVGRAHAGDAPASAQRFCDGLRRRAQPDRPLRWLRRAVRWTDERYVDVRRHDVDAAIAGHVAARTQQ